MSLRDRAPQRPFFGIFATNPGEARELRRGFAVIGLGAAIGSFLLGRFIPRLQELSKQTNTPIIDAITERLATRKTVILKQPLIVTLRGKETAEQEA